MRLDRRAAAWAGVAGGGVLVALAPAVLGLRTLSHRDTDTLYGPIRTLVVEGLREGRLPLWNPFEGTGKPLFAEGIHAVLHPISLLAALVAPTSIDFLILAWLVAASLGAFFLARALEASPAAAAGAGLGYALSGYSVSMSGNLVFLAGLSTLPWLLAAGRAAGRGDPRGPFLVALATASAFFAGDAQVTLLGLGLALLLAADVGGGRGALRCSAGVAVGTLLAAVQILATRALIPLTTRGNPLPPEARTQWALDPARLLEWVVPGLIRGSPAVRPQGLDGLGLPLVFAESLYLGLPLVFAAALGLARRDRTGRPRTSLALGGAALALLWLALGHHLGARQLLEGIPIWGQFRFSEKLMAPLSLCLACLAAYGVDRFAEGRLTRAWALVAGAVGAASGVLLLAVRVRAEATRSVAETALGYGAPFYLETLGAGLPHLLVAAAAIVAVDRLPGRARALGLAGLVALAPAAAVRNATHFGSPALRGAAPVLDLGPAEPVHRLGHPANATLLPEEFDDFVEVTLLRRARVLEPSTNVAARVDALGGYGAFDSLRLDRLTTHYAGSWVLAARRYALTHVAVPIPPGLTQRDIVEASTSGARLVQRDEARRVELWAVPHRPWAFFAARAVAVPSPEAAVRRVGVHDATGDVDTVVVEASAAPPTAPGFVLRVERGTEAVRIEAEALGSGLLVVQDAYWPGWEARIDGVPVPLLAADGLVRAIPFPAGRHTLELRYDPIEVRAGLAVSGLGALLCAALAVAAGRRRSASGAASDPNAG